ncbi:MAG: hypothetical protein IMF14_06515 [Proteobacteria bacterium]|nr:hypothetical protein [Pseudomonadota bacterium]
MNDTHDKRNTTKSSDKTPAKNEKPMSDFKVGLITFIVFIFFMTAWMSFYS